MVRKLFRKQPRLGPLQVRVLSLPLVRASDSKNGLSANRVCEVETPDTKASQTQTGERRAGEVLWKHASLPSWRREFNSPYPYLKSMQQSVQPGHQIPTSATAPTGIRWNGTFPASWCSGSTADSESAGPGSNPGEATCESISHTEVIRLDEDPVLKTGASAMALWVQVPRLPHQKEEGSRKKVELFHPSPFTLPPSAFRLPPSAFQQHPVAKRPMRLFYTQEIEGSSPSRVTFLKAEYEGRRVNVHV